MKVQNEQSKFDTDEHILVCKINCHIILTNVNLNTLR